MAEEGALLVFQANDGSNHHLAIGSVGSGNLGLHCLGRLLGRDSLDGSSRLSHY